MKEVELKMTDYTKRAIEILERINYATIATATKLGKPWNSPVYAVHDAELNIYWFSDRENQHSQNVRENENVFIVIYDSTVPIGEGEGLYLEAKAQELGDPEEIRLALGLKDGSSRDTADDFMDGAIRRAYKAVPQRAWTNDSESLSGKFVRDYRVEVSLSELRSLLASK